MKRRFRSEFAIAGRVNSGHFLEVFACLALFYETHFPQRHSATTTITTTTTTTTTTFAPITSTLPSLFAGQFSAISAPIELGQNSRIYNRSNASCVTRWKILVRYTILLRAVNSSRRFRGWNAITLYGNIMVQINEGICLFHWKLRPILSMEYTKILWGDNIIILGYLWTRTGARNLDVTFFSLWR